MSKQKQAILCTNKKECQKVLEKIEREHPDWRWMETRMKPTEFNPYCDSEKCCENVCIGFEHTKQIGWLEEKQYKFRGYTIIPASEYLGESQPKSVEEVIESLKEKLPPVFVPSESATKFKVLDPELLMPYFRQALATQEKTIRADEREKTIKIIENEKEILMRNPAKEDDDVIELLTKITAIIKINICQDHNRNSAD